MRMVVVLPAPFGPRKPTISPLRTDMVTFLTASTPPVPPVKVLLRPDVSITSSPPKRLARRAGSTT
ncbi:hypothetical protein [Nonomuraea harbinensis]|uniref:Uncharacterized protein n=1 Tax=Nonomuraea harbinensis TaxID=1286938 RepID=A0ABW1BXI7_9ACTN